LTYLITFALLSDDIHLKHKTRTRGCALLCNIWRNQNSVFT